MAEIINSTHETSIGPNDEFANDEDDEISRENDEPSKITKQEEEKPKIVGFHERIAEINNSTHATSIIGEKNEKDGKNISKCQYLLTNGKICSATFPMKPNFIREESEITAWYNIGHPRYHQNELPCGCMSCQLGK